MYIMRYPSYHWFDTSYQALENGGIQGFRGIEYIGCGQFFFYTKCLMLIFIRCAYKFKQMYEYGVSFKSVRYLEDYGNFHFCSRCVTFFYTNDEKSWVRIHYAAIPQCVEILFFTQSLRCLKICMVNPYMTFLFSWLGNMLHSDTPLIVAIITEGCRIME